tara:strand:- start:28 stop:330 length:303 start_codon:yes stop_codon:yes gene_type:complete
MNILITLTQGAIKNGYINLRGNLDKFESRYIGASGEDQHGHMLLLDIGDGETFGSDVCSTYHRFRNRTALKALLQKYGVKAGDTISLEKLSTSHWSISKL